MIGEFGSGRGRKSRRLWRASVGQNLEELDQLEVATGSKSLLIISNIRHSKACFILKYQIAIFAGSSKKYHKNSIPILFAKKMQSYQPQPQSQPYLSHTTLLSLFTQISTHLHNFLQTLSNLYLQHNLQFPFHPHHQEILLRIITPMELMALCDWEIGYRVCERRGDVENLLVEGYRKCGDAKLERDCQEEKGWEKEKQKGKDDSVCGDRDRDREIYYPNSLQIFEYSNQPKHQNPPPPMPHKTRKQQKFDLSYKNGTKFIRTATKSGGLQQKLINWIVEQHAIGNLVGRSETVRKAKDIGRFINFRASTGWYCNFMRRNPEVRRLLSEGNRAKKWKKSQRNRDQVKQNESQQENMIKKDQNQQNEGNQVLKKPKIESNNSLKQQKTHKKQQNLSSNHPY